MMERLEGLWYKIYILRFYILIAAVVSALGIYIGLIAFGDNGIEVLLKVKKEQASLELLISTLQSENIKLQKEIFELQSLEPNSSIR